MKTDCLTAVKAKPGLTGLVCVGNNLVGDDGIGIILSELLRNESLPKQVRVLEKGTGRLSVFYALSELDRAIIIDAVDFNGRPGQTRCFALKDVVTDKDCSGLSLHECDLLAIIDLFHKFNIRPPDITIYAIQPEAIMPGTGLSPALRAKLPGYIKEIIELLKTIKLKERQGRQKQNTEK